MKKSALIWTTAIILLAIAFLVTNSYGKNKNTLPRNNATSTSQVSSNAQGTTVSTSEEKAIDFTLKDLDGNELSLSDLKGKNVYLNFFATWCPPCRQEMPEIEKLYKEYKDRDFVVIAVDLGEDRDTVKNFITNNKYTFRVLLDSDGKVAGKYGINAIPVSYFIDKSGNVKAKRVGAMTESNMRSSIELLYK